jgi:hypothetical protein
VKPAEVAQTLLPASLKMAARSMLPVPTRLVVGGLVGGWVRVRWVYGGRYLVSTYAVEGVVVSFVLRVLVLVLVLGWVGLLRFARADDSGRIHRFAA